LAKRASCLVFDADSKLLCADRFGDVTRILLDKPDMKPELLCGHVSMLTDMCFMKNGKLLVTSDRDEKIRLTRYPETEVIHGFLLGHHAAVSKIASVSHNSDFLVSGGVDPVLLVWNVVTCQVVAEFYISAVLSLEKNDPSFIIRHLCPLLTENMVVVAENSPYAYILRVDPSTSELSLHCLVDAKAPIAGLSVDLNGNVWLATIAPSDQWNLLCFDSDGNSVDVSEELKSLMSSTAAGTSEKDVFVLVKEYRKTTEEELESRRAAKRARCNAE
jgi:tRNA (guanine-N(7)-)-methyltransferase subunit TRM82